MEEQMRNDEMEIDLIELFHVLLKKAWVILLCLVIGAVRILSPILCAIRWWSVRSSFTSQPEALVIF